LILTFRLKVAAAEAVVDKRPRKIAPWRLQLELTAVSWKINFTAEKKDSEKKIVKKSASKKVNK
jgi:hypothetical protein